MLVGFMIATAVATILGLKQAKTNGPPPAETASVASKQLSALERYFDNPETVRKIDAVATALEQLRDEGRQRREDIRGLREAVFGLANQVRDALVEEIGKTRHSINNEVHKLVTDIEEEGDRIRTLVENEAGKSRNILREQEQNQLVSRRSTETNIMRALGANSEKLTEILSKMDRPRR